MSQSDNDIKSVLRYYDRTESRIGYKYLLHGTKHFGWYEPGESMWQFARAMRRMEAKLGARLDLPEGARVLDAGCGMGDVARTMARQFHLNVTGIDILDFNLDEARRRSEAAGLSDRTEFLECDYHDLSIFESESFDGVYTMETFVHASDPEAVLAEFFRVLKPGGRLVMFEYSRTPEKDLSPGARVAFKAVCEFAAMPTWYRLDHGILEGLLADAGFEVNSVENVTQKMLPMLHAFAILGRVPYIVGQVIGKVQKVVNALSGVEMWRFREAWRYNIYVATKKG